MTSTLPLLLRHTTATRSCPIVTNFICKQMQNVGSACAVATDYVSICPKMASRAVALLIILLYFDEGVSEYSSAALSTHLDTLLAEYDREVAPWSRTVVTLELSVRHAAVEDDTSTMHLLADLKMNWVDSRLSWNASLWEGDSVLVSAERLWTPDVQLASAGRARDPSDAVRARLSANGAVARVARLDLVAPVPLQLMDWPRDAQEAHFTFASRAHDQDELELVIDESKGIVVVESGAWEVTRVSGALVQLQRSDGSSAPAASWQVRAARRGAAAQAQHGAVLAAAVLLLAAAALRPYTQRMPLAACATLVSALWLITVISAVPAAASTPRVVRVMCAVCVLGALSGACAALAQGVSRRTSPPPAALRSLLARLSALQSVTPDPDSCAESGAWAGAARLLDAVLAALLSVALLVLICVYLLA